MCPEAEDTVVSRAALDLARQVLGTQMSHFTLGILIITDLIFLSLMSLMKIGQL